MTQWGPIGQQVFDRTYSRTKEDGSKETFNEVVSRMVAGNVALVDQEFIDVGEVERLITLISEHKLVPAGRHWWVSGVPGRQFLFSCHRAGWTDQLADHVGFTFDELMKGGGVGANYSDEYMSRMHRIRRQLFVRTSYCHDDIDELSAVEQDYPSKMNDRLGFVEFTVDDTREGWVHALEYLCRLSQLEGNDLYVTFNVDSVRPRGSLIHGFGGTASGPGPLIKMLTDVARILNRAVGTKLTGLECMDIDHAIASCVIAGNVRRSARMSIKLWRDDDIMEFINLKANGGHWTTNISVEVDYQFWDAIKNNDPHAESVLLSIADGMHRNGEPGLFNSFIASHGERGDVRCTNPCGEIALEEWEQCNLGHINLARIQCEEEFEECARLMARWLIRATCAKGSAWRQWEVVQRNRRIGVGILGFQEWAWNWCGDKYSEVSYSAEATQRLENLRAAVDDEAAWYATHLGVPTPVKTTTVAPTGTVAKMSGVTEGIHPVYARHFIRRVRYAVGDPSLQEAIDAGLHCERDNNNPNTMVVEYPCRDSAMDIVPAGDLDTSDELSIYQKLIVQRMVQRAWANNAVSYTVNFDPKLDSPHQIAELLRKFGPELKGTTFMPEGSYEQAPLERITYEEYLAAGTQFSGSSADDCVGACPIK